MFVIKPKKCVLKGRLPVPIKIACTIMSTLGFAIEEKSASEIMFPKMHLKERSKVLPKERFLQKKKSSHVFLDNSGMYRMLK